MRVARKEKKPYEYFESLKKIRLAGIDKFLLDLQTETRYAVDVIKRLAFWYGFERALKLIDSLRRPAPFLALRVNTQRASPARVLSELRAVNINARPSRIFDDVILIDVTGPHKVKEAPKKVVAKDRAAEEVLLGADLYADGVESMDEDIVRGDPVNIVTRYGEVIAYGRAAVSASSSLKGRVVEVEESVYRVPNLRTTRPWIRGHVYYTTLASRQAHEWLDLEEARTVLLITPAPDDVAHVFQTAPEDVEITVVSKTQLEEAKLRSHLEAMKLPTRRIRWYVVDYRYLHLQPGYFDAIIVRPRCSKTGIRPRISCFVKEDDIVSLARTASDLLMRCAPALKKGGRLLVINTSLDPLEGECVLAEFFQRQSELAGVKLEFVETKIRWGDRGVDTVWTGEHVLRTYPDRHDLGLFAAVLERV